MALPPPNPIYDLRGVGAEVNCLHFSCNITEPSIPLLFSGSSIGQIHVWNLNTRRTKTMLNGHGGKSILWVNNLSDRENLISQGRDLQICKWNLAEGRNKVIDSIPMNSFGYCRCSLNTESRLLAMPGTKTSQVQVMDVDTKEIISIMIPRETNKFGMAMCMKLWEPKSGTSPLLLIGYEDGSIGLWHVLENRLMSRHRFHKEPVMSLDLDCDYDRGVSGSPEDILNVWSLDEQQNLKLFKAQEITNAGIADVRIRQDKKILATAGWDYRIRIFGWKKMKPLAVLQYHTETVNYVCFSDHPSPEDRLLAAGSKDKKISIWSIYSKS